MLLIVTLYLAVGLYMQCALFTLNPDWLDAETWRHLLLWPAYARPFLPAWPGQAVLPGLAHLPAVHWLYVVLFALFVLPLPVIWLAARRLRAHGRRRIRAARRTPTPAPETPSRLEPRFGT